MSDVAGQGPRKWLGVKDAAEALGVDESTVYRLCRSRKLAHHRIGDGKGCIRFTPGAISAYLESCSFPALTPESAPTPEPLATRLVYLRPQGSRSRRA